MAMAAMMKVKVNVLPIVTMVFACECLLVRTLGYPDYLWRREEIIGGD